MRLGLGVRHKKKRFKITAAIVCIVFLMIFISKRLEPVYDAQITSYANQMANDIVNKAVTKVFNTDNYNSFADIKTNDKQYAATVETDTGTLNKFKAQLLIEIQENMQEYDPKTVYLPLMSVSGLRIFSGIGPKVPLRIYPISIIRSEFDERFEDAGINQVRHRLVLKVSIGISCVGVMYSQNETTDIEIPVSDTIISGETPKYYGGFSKAIGEN